VGSYLGILQALSHTVQNRHHAPNLVVQKPSSFNAKLVEVTPPVMLGAFVLHGRSNNLGLHYSPHKIDVLTPLLLAEIPLIACPHQK
jgi:hypothetical protein